MYVIIVIDCEPDDGLSLSETYYSITIKYNLFVCTLISNFLCADLMNNTGACSTSIIQDECSHYNDPKISRYFPDIKRDSYMKCLHPRAIPACISLSVADCTALTAPSSIASELMAFLFLDFTTHLLNR